MACPFCAGSGWMIGHIRCSCGAADAMELPTSLQIPPQYQSIRFSKNLLPSDMQGEYGEFMTTLLSECTDDPSSYNKNVIVCSPPNCGKTVFAYSVIAILYAKGICIPEVMDLIEIRSILMATYNIEYDKVDLISNAPLAIIKIPQDLPSKFGETMSTIVERRVRRGGSTIFLFSGSKFDLANQDRFNKYKALLGDGSYNTIQVYSWERKYD